MSKSLKFTISLIVIGIFIFFVVADYIIGRFIIYPSFIELEYQEAQKDIKRCIEAIKREVFHLDKLCIDWATWDDTYAFIKSHSEEYIKSNLNEETFIDDELNLVYYLDKNGKVVWGKIYDFRNKREIELKKFSKNIFPKNHPLISFKINENSPTESGINGILVTEKGPMLISSHPILKTNGEGPVRGFLIMGRFFDKHLIKTLINKIHVNFKVYTIQDKDLGVNIERIINKISQKSYFIDKGPNKNLLAYTTYPDIYGRPGLIIKAIIPATISAKGRITIFYAVISIFFAGLISFLTMWFVLKRTILKPIMYLTNHAVEIRKTGDLSKRTGIKGKNEIAILAEEFDRMVDILEKKTAELAKINKELKEQIIRRKQAEQALRTSEEKLNRMKRMEAIALLAGGVAHDLNNVLSGIMGYPEIILMDKDLPQKFRKPIEMIRMSGEKAAAIVDDLLTTVRGIATNKEILNLNTIVEEYLNSPEYLNLIKSNPQVKVEVNLDKNLLNIKGSAHHIRKALMNLVSNAFEAIEGRGTVKISTKNQYIDKTLKGYDEIYKGEYVVLCVSDTGSGISKEDLDRIFEPFYTKKVMGRSGTGLGLTIVWNVVRDHQGYIDVHSNEKGTRFEIYFPVTREQIHKENSRSSIELYKGQGEKILIVDDEIIQREIISNMLITLNYNPVTVSSGEEAIEYIKENKVDLIVLDMIMEPGINGRKTYEEIIKIRPGQKAILVSGFSETEEVRKAQRLGAGKYLKKPFTIEKLAKAIKEELERK